MKKFLAFLLIALTVCSAVEEQIELDGMLPNFVKNMSQNLIHQKKVI